MLLALFQPKLDGVITPPHGGDAQRLQAYWAARAAYLDLGMRIRPNADPEVMLNQLREPLLAVVATSPDFRPAAEPLASLAKAVSTINPSLAAEVKQELQRAQMKSAQPLKPAAP